VNETRAARGVELVLLDIEGTTTPIAFVADVLFPYARRELRSHLETHAATAEYESILTRLSSEHASAVRDGEAVPSWSDEPAAAHVAGAVAFVEWLMDRDRKSTGLKELQGKIWEDGYRRGELVGQVFPDVPAALQRWRDLHVRVGIFSSGSVLAQQLLFRHSSAGDLTGLLQWYFDTRVGAKGDPDSYRSIAQAVGVPPEAVLFLSDTLRELDAARSAGMRVRLVVRPGNAPVMAAAAPGYEAIRSLDQATLE
jgi:enolase-phosphatase E1